MSIFIIEKVLKSGVLIESLMVLPGEGATDAEIEQEEIELSRQLSKQHKMILRRWNGINMDIMRLYGCSDVHEGLRRLSDAQVNLFPEVEGCIVFGDDPSGFMYAESLDGSVYSVQTATSEVKKLAASIDDFFERLVFGNDAREFGGADWEEELVNCGLL